MKTLTNALISIAVGGFCTWVFMQIYTPETDNTSMQDNLISLVVFGASSLMMFIANRSSMPPPR
jgi:hypothetical protein